MALVWTLTLLMVCLGSVEAYPQYRRNSDEGFLVAYRLPEGCVRVPSGKNYCNLNYKISAYREGVYQSLVTSAKTASQYFQFHPSCAFAVKKLICRLVFPECLAEENINYGNKKELFAKVRRSCPYSVRNMLKKTPFSEMPSGIVQDPHAPRLPCSYIDADPEGLCPKPKHKVLSSFVTTYYEQIRNFTTEAEKYRNEVPEECYEKAKNLFACSAYPFCSSDGKSVLLFDPKRMCDATEECFRRAGILNEEIKEALQQRCQFKI